MPETSLSGRRTRTARNVRKSNELLFLMLIVAKLDKNNHNNEHVHYCLLHMNKYSLNERTQ
jgi:hypothetical protein